MEELWKPVRGYEGLYEVSNYSQVRSLERLKKASYGSIQTVQERILRPCWTGRYLTVTLCRNSETKARGIHRWMAEAFIPNPENKLELNHIDGDRANNFIGNIEWCTRKILIL